MLTAADFLKDPKVRYGMVGFLQQVIRESSLSQVDRRQIQGNHYLNLAYYRGRAYIDGLVSGGDTLNTTTLQSDSTAFARQELASQTSVEDYTLPIYQGDVNKLVSVLGTRGPNVKAGTYNPSDPKLRGIERTANQTAAFIKTYLDTESINRKTVFNSCIAGTSFGMLYWNRDAARFGSRPVAYRTEQVQVPVGQSHYACGKCGTTESREEWVAHNQSCKKCGEPLGQGNLIQTDATMSEVQSVVGMQDANGCLDFRLFDGSMVEVSPFFEKVEDFPYMLIEFEGYKYSILNRIMQDGQNPQLTASMLEGRISASLNPEDPTSGSIRMANQSPAGLYSLAGSALRDLWLESHLTLTPAMYTAFDDKLDPSGRIREDLTKLYPEGAKIMFVNSIPVGCYKEVLKNQLSVCKPTLTPGVYSDAIFSVYREGVDVINVLVTLMIDIVKHSPGEIFYDPTVIQDAVLQTAPNPGRWIPMVANAMDLAKRFYQIPGAKFDEALPRLLDSLMNMLRECIGITPALFGGGVVEQTARGAEIRRTQALMQHQINWASLRQFHASLAENAARLLASNSDGKIYGRLGQVGQGQDQLVVANIPEISSLQSRAWFYSTEEAMPLSPGARRDFILDILQNPQSATAMSVIDVRTGTPFPQALPMVREAASLPDWWFQGEAAYQHIQEIINRIIMQAEQLQGELQQMQATGQQVDQNAIAQQVAQIAPMPDLDLFNGSQVVEWLQEFLHSQRGQDLEGSMGYYVVLNYLKSWVQAMMPPPMPADAQGGAPASAQGQAPASASAPAAAPPPPPLDPNAGPVVPEMSAPSDFPQGGDLDAYPQEDMTMQDYSQQLAMQNGGLPLQVSGNMQ
jgi:hypothetical protein